MQKIVVNKCYGGFGLSYKGVMRYAEIKGIKIYAFTHDYHSKTYTKYEYNEDKNSSLIHYFTTDSVDNENFIKSYFYERDIDRNDIALVQVVEELGDKSNGDCAKLRITEIPDDVEWSVEEYDGMEHVSEKHATW